MTSFLPVERTFEAAAEFSVSAGLQQAHINTLMQVGQEIGDQAHTYAVQLLAEMLESETLVDVLPTQVPDFAGHPHGGLIQSALEIAFMRSAPMRKAMHDTIAGTGTCRN